MYLNMENVRVNMFIIKKKNMTENELAFIISLKCVLASKYKCSVEGFAQGYISIICRYLLEKRTK